jgi:hypothetical protein
MPEPSSRLAVDEHPLLRRARTSSFATRRLHREHNRHAVLVGVSSRFVLRAVHPPRQAAQPYASKRFRSARAAHNLV